MTLHTPTPGGIAGLLASRRIQILLIAVLGIAAYANSFDAPFILDDEGSITNNPFIWDLDTFLGGGGYSYNPRRYIGYLTLALNYRFGGLDVTGYHAVNLAIHLVTAFLVYGFALLTLRTPPFQAEGETGTFGATGLFPYIPLFAALLFVVHPVQTQAVTYIVQRFASLVSLFYVAAMAAYALARLRHEDGGWRRGMPWYILALCAALLAVRTKELAVTLPGAILLYEFVFFPRNRKKKLLVLLPVLALVGIVMSLGMLSLGKPLDQMLADVAAMTRKTQAISRADYLITQFPVMATYLRLLVLPVNQNLDYDYPVYHSLLQPQAMVSFLLVCAFAGLALFLFIRSRGKGGAPPAKPHYLLAGFGIVWFFLTQTIESTVIPFPDVIFEHRLYLPSVGAFLAAAVFLAAAARKLPQRVVVTAAAAAVVVLAATTYVRNETWRDEVVFWKDVAAKSPGKGRPHHNLARAYKERGMLAEAETEYLAALKITPTHSDSYTNLGVIYRMQNRPDEAIRMHLKAMQYGPRNPAPPMNLGVVLASSKRYREAEEAFREALRLNPLYVDALFNLGLVHREQGDATGAEEAFRAVLDINPKHARSLHQLGLCCLATGRRAEAEIHLRRAAELNPASAAFAADLQSLLISRPPSPPGRP